MPDRRPRPFACEDEARDALAGAAGLLGGAGAAARVSLRWNRSGAQGLLLLSRGTVQWLSSTDAAAGAEGRLHRDIYRGRSDVAAIVRSRPVFSTALACLPAIQEQGLPIICPEDSPAAGDAIRCAAAGPPGSAALSEHVLAALAGGAACLLAGRGLLVTGHTLQTALDLATELEALAQIHVQVLQLRPAVPGDLSPGR